MSIVCNWNIIDLATVVCGAIRCTDEPVVVNKLDPIAKPRANSVLTLNLLDYWKYDFFIFLYLIRLHSNGANFVLTLNLLDYWKYDLFIFLYLIRLHSNGANNSNRSSCKPKPCL